MVLLLCDCECRVCWFEVLCLRGKVFDWCDYIRFFEYNGGCFEFCGIIDRLKIVLIFNFDFILY